MNLQQVSSSNLPDIGAILKRFFIVPGAKEAKYDPSGQFAFVEQAKTLDQMYMRYPETGTFSEKIPEFIADVQLNPNDPDAHFRLAIAFSQLENWEHTVKESQIVIDLLSKSRDIYRNVKVAVASFILGYAYGSIARRQEGEEAHRSLLRAEAAHLSAIKYVPNFAEAYYYLGAVYSQMHRWKEAESFYGKAIEFRPDYSEAYSDLGILYLNIGRAQEALTAFMNAVRVNPEGLIAVKNLGKTFLDFGFWQDAKGMFEQAIKINPSDADAYSGLGAAYYHLSDWIKAESLFKKAIQLDPNDAFAHSNLGVIYATEGLLKEAYNEISEALRIDPQNANLLRNMKRLNEIIDGQKRNIGSESDRYTQLYGAGYRYIAFDQSGTPIITGTNTKVIELVQDMIAHGWSPDELKFQYPHLSMGQIHSALAYYWDNTEILNQDIEHRLEKVERIRKAIGPSALRTRLRSKGLI
ncbi:MAG TPA: tetratricopeptide repeat protein [Pyrinomonadaceae bacterium]